MNSEALAVEVKNQLEKHQLTLSTCESLTCGMIASILGGVPGISAVYAGGAVTYMTYTKHLLADVKEAQLYCHGAVDPETAIQMASGIQEKLHTDVSVAVTGNAGPDPMEGKPVGQVYIAVSYLDQVTVHEYVFPGERQAIREATAVQALQDILSAINA